MKRNTLVLYCQKTHDVLTYYIVLGRQSYQNFVAYVNDVMNQVSLVVCTFTMQNAEYRQYHQWRNW